ncbi:RRP12-like protein [Trifolium pratense]|uniref:Uncharacterized protein n=2 Tax=Trifolium pratense TaxID=57577 RepID=A0ACB0LNE8_TRIPR|nr:uncharacterized protein LOC123889792 [Trifolium pratense]PNX74012.1 RRP12-like protein [Trifolium pratense]CAJ2669957.1 unnamed protein product [Trifolium pratense]
MEEEIEVNKSDEDFSNSILSEFGSSTNESHRHLCIAVGSISEVIKTQNLPSSPVVYLAYTLSSLTIISNGANPVPISDNILFDVFLKLLSLVIVKVPVDVVRKTRESSSQLIATVIVFPSISETAVVDGFKCLEHLFNNGEEDIVLPSHDSPLFNVLSKFLTDSRPHVRRQCHLCLRNILINFQKSPLLGSASESVINLLEKVPLLAGGANANADEGTKGAQQVLYILDALKECLPLLSLKYKNNILKHFKCKCW